MSNNTLDLRRHVRNIKKNRWLIAVSTLIFLLLTLYYWQYHMPEYKVKSVMLIEEEQDNGTGATMRKAGGISQMMRAFSIGGFGASSVDNERIIAETHHVMVKTIQDLGLNCTYIGHDGISREILYGGKSPIKVEAPAELYDTLKVGLKMKIKLNGDKADIKVKKGFFRTIASFSNVTLPYDLKTKYGNFRITKTPPTSHFKEIPDIITVNISGNNSLAEYFRKKIDLDLYDKKADAIEFTYYDACPERGIDFLNTLMQNYNNVRKDHKDEVSRKEIEFYDNRIASLAQDLSNADNRMVEFKRQNNIVDIETQAEAMIKTSAANQQEQVKLQAEIEINQMVLNSLSKGSNEVLPALGNIGAITQYNELIASKQELERSAKPNNEVLVSLNNKIADARKSITESAKKNIEASRIKLGQLNQSSNQDQSKMSRVPSQEKEYLNLLRDKELKNELFIFLMQRRESSMLQLTKNSSPSFIIDKAYSSVKPNKIKPLVISLILLLMGVLLPIVWILYRMKKNDKIEDTFDLDENWEERAFSVPTKSKKQSIIDNKLREIRAKLFEMDGVNTLYVHNLSSSNDVLNRFITSVEKGNKTIARLKVNDVDQLYSQDFIDKLEKSKNSDFTFVEIENLETTGEINDILTKQNCGLIVIAKKNKTKRKDFKKLTQEYKELDKTMVIIH